MDTIIQRQFWIDKIEEAWKERSIIWLSGVRRTGKTFLTRSLADIEYFDCELPRTRRMMEDPEGFLSGLRGKRIILDEVHRLYSPSEILKIAADHYKDIRVLATGSSTLGASKKFKDTLTDRKTNLWLTPMIQHDMKDFRKEDLRHRFLHGGLPPFFQAKTIPENNFQEWMDSYWAKDIQELFRLEKRYSFQKFAELIMAGSGGIFEATKYATPCEVSRTTIMNYLHALEETYVANIIRPYNTHKATEIVSAPKVYAFDTGFVCCHKGWYDLRSEDMGLLWEHYVLNELNAQLQSRDIKYWRDKRGHEIDFVIAQRGKDPITIECKWSANDVDPKGLKAFRRAYPDGDNYIVSHDISRTYTRHYDGIAVSFVSLSDLIKNLSQ